MSIEFETTGPGADAALLAAFEGRTGLRIPVACRQLLHRHNGGELPSNFLDTPTGRDVGVGVTEMLGVDTGDDCDIEVRLRELRGRAPDWFLPLFDAECGNVVGVSVSDSDEGRVYFWDHEREGTGRAVVEVADTLDAFMESLRPVDDWDDEDN
ncbi:hypothetical protein BN159_7500 [Streptomyces davaonensis JCM 4913]|uniref:Knr4/Smi1-like domain-containing protein n=1 Tax=Streptomyces davaonensis (strain DSM 101723 / JCM 4913 / KCC S-0913 / 768) TaxID=1214101 RepID=K4RFL7_STRDJ|nr:SMI1/KNR4 family protein [Streptomyces davaonensis]CCK31879.1 hypothetical protein BN159_7500 [Streptomyces davaonensis JCM 4913]